MNKAGRQIGMLKITAAVTENCEWKEVEVSLGGGFQVARYLSLGGL